MVEEIWRLVPYNCQDGECLMIWNIEADSKLGALSLDHKSIGEGIVEELNKLENYNKDIKIYVERVEDVNDQLRYIRDVLVEENMSLKQFQDNVFSWIDNHLEKLSELRDIEFESDDEFADPSIYSGGVDILKTMKKELMEK